jgi:NhaP-type Na+/H+ or K+/H+ antiporter
MRGVMKNVSFFFEIVIFILLGYSMSVPLIEGDHTTETIAFILANPGILILGLVTAVLVIFVARPISVFLVTAGDRSIGLKDRFFLSWAGVKGVASAALAAIAVTVIIQFSNAPSYVLAIRYVVPTIYAIVFIVLIVSLFLQGLTTTFFANILGLTEKQDLTKEITVHRDATRQALLYIVDQYTEGKIDAGMYSRLKGELEEEIFNLEDELRRVVSEKRLRIKELRIREEIFKKKLEFYEQQFETGKISESVFQDLKNELTVEIEEIINRITIQEQRINQDDN